MQVIVGFTFDVVYVFFPNTCNTQYACVCKNDNDDSCFPCWLLGRLTVVLLIFLFVSKYMSVNVVGVTIVVVVVANHKISLTAEWSCFCIVVVCFLFGRWAYDLAQPHASIQHTHKLVLITNSNMKSRSNTTTITTTTRVADVIDVVVLSKVKAALTPIWSLTFFLFHFDFEGVAYCVVVVDSC